jgi:hypothetical protein
VKEMNCTYRLRDMVSNQIAADEIDEWIYGWLIDDKFKTHQQGDFQISSMFHV